MAAPSSSSSSSSHVFRSHWRTQTLPPHATSLTRFLLTEASRFGDDHVCFVDAHSGAQQSVATLRRRVVALAAALRARALEPRATLMLFSPNCLDYWPLVHGALCAEATVTTASPAYTAGELAHQLVDSSPHCVATPAELLPTLTAAVTLARRAEPTRFRAPRRIVVLESSPELSSATVGAMAAQASVAAARWSGGGGGGGGGGGDGDDSAVVFESFDALLDAGMRATEHAPYANAVLDGTVVLRERVAMLPYSSGTTGRAKGVQLTHANIVWNCLQQREMNSTYMTRHDTMLAFLPMYHIYCAVQLMAEQMQHGVRVVVMRRFTLDGYLAALERFRVTISHIVPPVAVLLAKSPLVDDVDLSSLRVLFAGAAPLSSDTQQQVEARLRVSMRQGYGMTELSPVVCAGYPGAPSPPGSSGRIVSNCEVRIVDPATGADQPAGAEGELWARGPNVMLGYLNNERATRDTVTADGWLRTGDIAKVSAEGNVFITDRLKELIKTRGFQVPPAELESLLLEHALVADVAVIPVPDDNAGELPRAYVVLKQRAASDADAEQTKRALFDHVAARAAYYKQLKGGVELVAEIPKSPSGKILRRKLRDQYKQEQAAAAALQRAKL